MAYILNKANADDIYLEIPGQWRPANITPTGKLEDVVKRTATVSCPSCGQSASLSNHMIDAHGNVTPSLVCPYDGCTFHEWVKLDGWPT